MKPSIPGRGPSDSSRVDHSGTVSFERAVAYYDRTRALSGPAMGRLIAILAAELRGRGPALEIGVGTGRMALPLSEAGIPMVGIDLSRAMLRSLMDHAGGRRPFPLAMADATRLPFAGEAFGAGVASHVLHLIPAWRRALTELVAAIRPGGLILVDWGSWGGTWWRETQFRFAEEAGIDPIYPGAQSPDELDSFVQGLGAAVRLLEPVADPTTTSVEEWIARLEEGIYSYTWRVDEQTRRAAALATRRWAVERFGPLRQPRRVVRRIEWRAYDLP